MENKIYESHYYANIKNHPIGSEWVQLDQLSQWDCISKVQCFKDGFSYRLAKYLRTGEKTCDYTSVTITDEISEKLNLMGYIVK